MTIASRADANASRPEKTSHVAIMICVEGAVENGGIIGTARNWVEAERAVVDAGYTLIRENEGGQWDFYDDEDGPSVQGYEPDGMGVYILAVEG